VFFSSSNLILPPRDTY